MRKIKLTVGAEGVDWALTWAYPNGQSLGNYWIPIYPLTVVGKDASGATLERKFHVLRFGVQCNATTPRVVGLADFQTHVIKAWLPSYTVHSARSEERGAWQVHGNFLIHDGPDNPRMQVYASIGCIEICGGPRGFDAFNDLLIALAGPSATSRAEQLAEIGQSKAMTITYLQAKRPALIKVAT